MKNILKKFLMTFSLAMTVSSSAYALGAFDKLFIGSLAPLGAILPPISVINFGYTLGGWLGI